MGNKGGSHRCMSGWAGGCHRKCGIQRTTLFHTCGCGLRGIIHSAMATTCQRVYFLLACHLAMLMSSIVAHAAMLIVLVSPGLLQTCLNIHALGSPPMLHYISPGSHPCTCGENREYFRVSYDLRSPLARTCLNIHAFDCFNNIVILA